MVVADDDVCYRLGPVLFETTSIGSVVAEGDENVAARRVTIQLTGDDVERFAQLTSEAAAATADVPTGQLAFLLDGALLHVATIDATVLDGAITLRAAGHSFDPAIITMFEAMTRTPQRSSDGGG